RQHHKVVRGLLRRRALPMVANRDVSFHPDDGLDARFLRFPIKINGTVEGAVIGQSQGIHSQLAGPGHHLRDAAHPVQEAVLRMDMEMGEWHWCYCSGSGIVYGV